MVAENNPHFSSLNQAPIRMILGRCIALHTAAAVGTHGVVAELRANTNCLAFIDILTRILKITKWRMSFNCLG